MSVTLVLVPVSLSSGVVMGLVTSLVGSIALTAERTREFEEERKNPLELTDIMVTSAMNKQYEQYHTLCSQYKTTFTDESLLVKTIVEHGMQNVNIENGKISGNIENIKFEFEKQTDGVYEMYITHKESDDLTIVDELKEEYQSNVQEQAYLNIKEGLENRNLYVETEEVMEDNSIMITVNLE